MIREENIEERLSLFMRVKNIYHDAKPRTRIKWKEMKSIVGFKWKPGANLPFDPIATKKASNLKLKVIIIGKSISNLKNYLENKKWKGTEIL